MWHTTVFRLPAPGAIVGADVPAVEDPIITLSPNGHPIFDIATEIPCAYVFGSITLTRAQIATPKLRVFPLPNIVPVDSALTPTSRPPFQDWYKSPLKLNSVDEIQFLGFDTAGATDVVGALFISDGVYTAPAGPVIEVHGSALIVGVNNQWTPGGFVLDQPLPDGWYTVVGMRVFGPNLAFARLIFPRTSGPSTLPWRPGILTGAVPSFIAPARFLEGGLGEYGRFRAYAQPQLEIFCHGGAGSTQDVYLQLVRVGGPTG